MIHDRHPAVPDTMITHLSEPNDLQHFLGASTSCEKLRAVGYAAPDWRSLATQTFRSSSRRARQSRRGLAARCVFFHGKTFPRFSVRLLSGGSACDAAFPGRPLVCSACYSFVAVRLDLFRVLLLRRKRLLLPLSSRSCRCGRPLDITAQVARGRGVFGRRGFALESAAARVCAAKQEHKSPGSLRSLLKAFQLSTGPSWRSTPLWSHPSVLMASSTDDVLTWTGPRPWRR